MKVNNIKNLEDAFEWLDSLDSPDIQIWLNETEEKAIAIAHHGFGTMVRNELDLWHDGSIVQFFNKLGIYHADDMSSIILISYHRKMNEIDLDLDGQVEKYNDYWGLAYLGD